MALKHGILTAYSFGRQCWEKSERIPLDQHIPQENELRVASWNWGSPLHNGISMVARACASSLTSLEISYTRYLFKMKPCCPRTFTNTVSCFFHQSRGKPVPEILDGAPLVWLLKEAGNGLGGALGVVNLEAQGSSAE